MPRSSASLVVSLLLFFLLGNATGRPHPLLSLAAGSAASWRRCASFPRHATLEENVQEAADNVLLGPTRHDALRLFPRGATVTAVMVSGRTLYLDLTPQILVDDPEVPAEGGGCARRAHALAAS